MVNGLIAVAVLKNGTISPHAGKTVRWQVYIVTAGQAAPQPVWSLELSRASSLHEWHVQHEDLPHPLHAVNVAIVQSAGAGVTQRLAAHDTKLLTTTESDPLTAVRLYLEGELPPGQPHDDQGCGHSHHHGAH
ncbi:NifB/NifX family molybdenum-iron cluster-binding protein [Gynuella sp.]|uniref:NifB/NifX family molybdenum-iron cluster-binding protein n=1 Tax=Gynuella sp. TaxID=2969146 RepID=UPI003D0B1CA6